MDILTRIIELSNEFSGTVGIAVRQTSSPDTIFHNAHMQFPTASCIKLAVLVELSFWAMEGMISLNDKITMNSEHQVPGTGILKDLRPGLEISLADLATLSITVSDNSAANILIDTLGMDAINARIERLGMKNTFLGTKFVFDDPKRNLGSPADFCNLLSKLWEKSILDVESCNWLLGIMERQQYVDYIPRYLPYNRFATEFGLPQKVSIANKVGMLSGVVNDMAIVSLPGLSYIVVIFTKDCADLRFGPDNEGALVLAGISKLIYDHFTHQLNPHCNVN